MESMGSKTSRGMTLLEILIVLAIIVVFAAMIGPNIASVFKVSVGSSSREIAGLAQETFNAALMNKRVYRLVVDFKENEYWVESGPDTLLLESEDARTERERLQRQLSIGSKSQTNSNAPSAWNMDPRVNRKRRKLPVGVKFEKVISEQFNEPITEKIAYAHFLPSGIVEQTIIQIKDNSNHISSIVLRPFHSKPIIKEKDLNREEAFPK